MKEKSDVIELYRRELKRIAWRLQYKAKVKIKHELPLKFDLPYSDSFTEHSDNKIFIQHLFDSIPDDAGRNVIYQIYFNDKTEAQIAREMKISQQAVNRWKIKVLQLLRQKLSS